MISRSTILLSMCLSLIACSSGSNTSTQPTPETEITTVDLSNTTAFCADAGNRIETSVEIGMTRQQVSELVGKPIRTRSSSAFWDYGRNENAPKVQFKLRLVNGVVTPTVVTDFATDTTGCSNDDDALIEAANALAQEPFEFDLNETPTCLDASIRMLAYLEIGMTTNSAQLALGKPLAMYYLRWDYGRGENTPKVRFVKNILDDESDDEFVSDYDSDISDCP